MEMNVWKKKMLSKDMHISFRIGIVIVSADGLVIM